MNTFLHLVFFTSNTLRTPQVVYFRFFLMTTRYFTVAMLDKLLSFLFNYYKQMKIIVHMFFVY